MPHKQQVNTLANGALGIQPPTDRCICGTLRPSRKFSGNLGFAARISS